MYPHSTGFPPDPGSVGVLLVGVMFTTKAGRLERAAMATKPAICTLPEIDHERQRR
jgi:hypothetical protein